MLAVTIAEAEVDLAHLITLVQGGEEVVITENDEPVADLVPHKPRKRKIKFGTAAGKLHYKDEDFEGLDPDIQEMFYGKNWDKN